MKHTHQKAKYGNMDLKTSVRHMSDAFLNGIETKQEEAVCLVLQI